jgi:hypothetical protein
MYYLDLLEYMGRLVRVSFTGQYYDNPTPDLISLFRISALQVIITRSIESSCSWRRKDRESRDPEEVERWIERIKRKFPNHFKTEETKLGSGGN